MALYPRYVEVVDSVTGDDTRGSGSSAALKDSDVIAGDTLVITNAAGGSTITKALGGAFAGPPVARVDTIVFTDTVPVGTLTFGHIDAVSADAKTLTLVEAPSTGTSIGNPWGIGGYIATIPRAATLVTPTNPNAGADDHVYVKASATYTGTVKVTWSKPGSRSRQLVIEGYTTTAGDGGQATYDTTATAVVGFEPNAVETRFRNWKLTNSGNVASWIGLSGTASGGRTHFNNIWVTNGAGTNNAGFTWASNNVGQFFQCRADSFLGAGSNGYGFSGTGSLTGVYFSIVHDTARQGFLNLGTKALFCVADTTCSATTALAGFQYNLNVSVIPTLFSLSYNTQNTNDGLRILDGATTFSNVTWGCIFANNAGWGLNRVGVTAGFMVVEQYNDFFSNALGNRQNEEDASAYDVTPTDLTANPGFKDAPNQDFRVGAAAQKTVAVALLVGGTSYLDMGAIQRDKGGSGVR